MRPNAIASLSGGPVATYGYDANGNVTSDGVRTYTQMSFNLPKTITKAATTLTFLYGPEYQRIKKSRPGKDVYYLDQTDDMGMRLEKEVAGTLTTYKHYLSAGGNIFGLYSQPSTGAAQTRYFHRDNLGSITAVTNETGGLVERLAYDAWGKRRQINGQPDSTNSVVGQNTALGYTGHEHLDEVGLIHMNGRIYDPATARFLSPDPVIQNPLDMQNLNRYSYVLNNPLKYTDPSGWISEGELWGSPGSTEYNLAVWYRDQNNPVNQYLNSITAGSPSPGVLPTSGSYSSGDLYYASSGAVLSVYFYSGSAWSTSTSPVYGSSSTTSTVTVNAGGSTTYSTTWTYTNSTIPPSTTQPGPTSSTGSSSGTAGNATHQPTMTAGGALSSPRSGTWDPVTDRRIGELDPRFQPVATEFINTVESETAIQLRVTAGYRSAADQDDLYAIGRTEPGNIVTNARGGESLHNSGLAIDVVQMQNGRPNWTMSNSSWQSVGQIGERLGMQWGGRWTGFVDRPHFQWSPP